MLTHFHAVLALRELVMQVVCLKNSTIPSQVTNLGFISDKRLMVFYGETGQVWIWRTIGGRALGLSGPKRAIGGIEDY